MKELFSFLNEESKVRLHTLLGQHISRHLKKQFPEPTIDLFNSVNRKELAREIVDKYGKSASFLIHKYNYTTTRTYTEREFFDDIIHFVDLKIPLYYYRQTMLQPNDDWIRFKKHYKGINMFPGMKFEFFQNIEREKKWINQSLKCIEVKDIKEKPPEPSKEVPGIELTLKPIPKSGSKASQNQLNRIQSLSKNIGISITNLDILNKKNADVLVGNLSRGVLYTPLFVPKNLDLAYENIQRLALTETGYNKDNFEANLLILEQRKYAYRNLNKANLKNVLIRPMLKILGYDLENPNEIYEDFELGDKIIDFAIMKNGKPFILIGIGDNKQSFEKMINPLLNKVPTASYAIYTNGDDYHIYSIQNGKELFIMDTACIRANSHNTPILYCFSKDGILGDKEPALLTHLKNRTARLEQINQVTQIIKNPPQELLEVLAKQGIKSESVISIFHDAVNAFSSECKKTS